MTGLAIKTKLVVMTGLTGKTKFVHLLKIHYYFRKEE